MESKTLSIPSNPRRGAISLALLLLGFFGLPLGGFAQDTLGAAWYEARTKLLYELESWPELIACGDSALAEGHDYFALRRRMGYAYFVQSRYQKAIPHLRAAAAFDGSDRFVVEQLIKSLNEVGRGDDARLMGKHYSHADRKKYGIHAIEPLKRLGWDGSFKVSSRPKIVGNTGVVNVYTRSWVGFRTELFQSFTYLNQGLVGGNYHQFQYYIGSYYHLIKGLNLQGAYHRLGLSGSQEFSHPDTVAPASGWPKKAFSTTANLFSMAVIYHRNR